MDAKAKNGLVYMEILRRMYGPPEAGILANKPLLARLEKFGYFKLPHTPRLCKNIYRLISFMLLVDDFGIKKIGEEHDEHLIKAVLHQYSFKVDQTR